MRSLFVLLLLATAPLWAQNANPPRASGQSSNSSSSNTSKPAASTNPNFSPPRSDSVNIKDLGNDDGESSSKDTQIDLSPPAGDAKEHPRSSGVLMDEEGSSAGGDVEEMHPWDPHKAAKDIEVGDFYFKRKNYRAAEDRYREALYYKDNDALATYRLAICLEKLDRPEDARAQYENYLKILPHGPQAEDAKKAIERINHALSATAVK